MGILSSATLVYNKVGEVVLHLYRGKSLSCYRNTCLGNKPLTWADFLILEFCSTQSGGMWVPLWKFSSACSSDCAATLVLSLWECIHQSETIICALHVWNYTLSVRMQCWVSVPVCVTLRLWVPVGHLMIWPHVVCIVQSPSVYWYWCPSVIAPTCEWSTDVNVYVNIGRAKPWMHMWAWVQVLGYF